MVKKKKFKIKRNYESVGALLAKARDNSNLSQAFVANKLGYSSPQFISNMERGIALPTKKGIKTLVDLYDLNPKVLVSAILKAKRTQLEKSIRG